MSIRALALPLVLAPLAPDPGPGAQGGPGLALTCAKALTCAADDGAPQHVDLARVLVRDGRIEAVGPRDEVGVPEGYVEIDAGESWVMPGLIDLHSHIGGSPDWGTHVYLTNPGPRISTSVVPNHVTLKRALTGGVTTVLYIPGSGTNMSGQGVLMKVGGEHYEDMLLRDPGSLKVAQAGNPEDWSGFGVTRAFMNWNLRVTVRRGLAYAAKWERWEHEGGVQPDVEPEWEVFRNLAKGEISISAHTQIAQVVLETITMFRDEFDLQVFIDHGTFDGWRVAAVAQEKGVPAILGPRSITRSMKGSIGGPQPVRIEIDTDGSWWGIAAKYQENGHRMIGFNTDAIDTALLPPILGNQMIKAEELSIQAAMAVRYGMTNDHLEAVRGLTIVPAMTVGLDDRIGSLEPGKDADLLLLTGDPADARTAIECVLIEGAAVHGDLPEPRATERGPRRDFGDAWSSREVETAD